MSQVMGYATEKLHKVDGQKVQLEDFYRAFKAHCDARGVTADPVFSVMQEISTRSDRFLVGQRNGKHYLLNVSLDPKAKVKTALEVNTAGRF